MTEKFVSTVDQIVHNVFALAQMACGDADERAFHHGRIKNGKLFVAVESQSGWMFAPSKFCGYINNGIHHADLLNERDGRSTNLRIDALLGDHLDLGEDGYAALDLAYLSYCDGHGISPSRHHRPRRYWPVGISNIFPDEIGSTSEIYNEGAVKSVVVNKYERDPAARAACIQHFGYVCRVCEFDFEAVYGSLGRDFIHVHHIIPLSELGEGYRVNPVTDLLPVCPNCHAMLHRGKETLSPDALRLLIGRT